MGALAGSILLLLRGAWRCRCSRCRSSLVLATIYSFGLSDGMAVMGAGGAVFSAVIFIIALGLVLYSKAMRTRGVIG